MSSDRQDTLNKRKVFTRSDAVVGDDDNKMERTLQRSNSPKKRFSKIIQRDHSYDSLGIDILRFVENTLHKNAKDREFLLFIEEEIRKFVEDESKCYHFFPAMSSYNRMLVHRVAAFFGLSHNVDQTGQQVVVTKQKGLTRVPDIKFSCLIKHSNFEDKCHFGRRNVQSFDESNISTLGNHQNSTTNFGPPSSFRAFRNRFYTCGGQTNSTEVNKGRRTRSFEISDWSNSTASNPLWNQQFASFCHFQPSTNLEIVTAGMGDAMSSNCSSSASSGAVQLQGGGSGIPFQIYPSGQFVLANEASLISPSSAFSEPPTKQLTYQQGFTEEIEEKREEGTVAENKNNLILTTTTEAGGGGERVGGVNANIPSLFSLQQIMQQNTNIGGNNYPQNYQQFINPYLTLQYQPMLVNASSNAQYQYYNENANMLHYYPTYYPIYQPQSGIVDSNLMTGENDSNKPLERQLKGLSICQEQNENNNGNNNGPKYNGNNNNVAKPTCY